MMNKQTAEKKKQKKRNNNNNNFLTTIYAAINSGNTTCLFQHFANNKITKKHKNKAY